MRSLKVALIVLLGVSLLSLWLMPGAAPASASGPLAITETFTPTATVTVTETPVPGPTNTPGPVNTPTPTATLVTIILDPLITKAVSIEQAQTGDVVLFTITITNPNSVAVTGVKVVDPLPNLVDFITATAGGVGTYLYDPATHTVTFDLGTLAAGQVVIMTVRAQVNQLGQAPDVFRNVSVATTNGGGSSSSNTTSTTLIPGLAPGAGVGPGPMELALTMAGVIAAMLVLFGGAALVLARLTRRPG